MLVGLVAAAGIGLWWWNNQRIKALKQRLAMMQSQPPARGSSNWEEYIRLALDIYGSVAALFAPGGPFSKKGSPSEKDVLDYISRNNYKYDV